MLNQFYIFELNKASFSLDPQLVWTNTTGRIKTIYGNGDWPTLCQQGLNV